MIQPSVDRQLDYQVVISSPRDRIYYGNSPTAWLAESAGTRGIGWDVVRPPGWSAWYLFLFPSQSVAKRFELWCDLNSFEIVVNCTKRDSYGR